MILFFYLSGIVSLYICFCISECIVHESFLHLGKFEKQKQKTKQKQLKNKTKQNKTKNFPFFYSVIVVFLLLIRSFFFNHENSAECLKWKK